MGAASRDMAARHVVASSQVAAWIGRLTGFALMAAYWPAAYGDNNVARWAAAWLGVAVLLWFVPSSRSVNENSIFFDADHNDVIRSLIPDLILLLFLILANSSFLWSPVKPDAIGEMLRLALLAGAFMVGRAGLAGPIFEGAAFGLIPSSAVVIGQVLGWHPVDEASWHPGLFGNRDMMAEAALMPMIWAAWHFRWGLAIAVIPALLIPLDRAVIVASFIVAAIGVAADSRARWLILPMIAMGIVLAASLTLYVSGKQNSMNERLAIWSDTVAGLTWKGRGVGQYSATFPEQASHFRAGPMRPDHAHSDYLEIAYEYGPAGLLLAALLAAFVIGGPPGWERLAFLGFAVVACFGFPLHDPATAVLALCAAGGVYRARDLRRDGAPRPAMAAATGARIVRSDS
jgi:hypothetical protein